MQGSGLATDRGQSGPLGLVLVIALVIASTTAVVVVGAEAITTTQGQLDIERTENTMTQFDSKAALVALGQSRAQQLELPASSGSEYDVREDAGWMNVTYTNASGNVATIRNGSLGAVVYDGDGTEIAYQGGGVWRADADGGAVMVSPPEFHYRSKTLTLPLVTVSGEGSLNRRATVTRNNTAQHFPDPDRDKALQNPLNGSDINVTVKSDYYRAWGSYFEDRTDGTVTYDHPNETVTAELVIPFEASFNNVVATTDPGGITPKGKGGYPSPYDQGISFPSVDSRIENKVSDCESGGSCDESEPSTISTSGTYYYDDDPSDLTVDGPNGNVTIVVNDDFTSDDFEINGTDDDEVVTVYVRQDFTVTDEMNKDDGDPTDLKTLIHSDGDVELKGNTKYVGVLIAPGSTCEQRGKGTVEGGVICKQMNVRGNPSNDFYYDPAIQGMGLDLTNTSDTQITYLHVSTNNVNVTDA